MHLRSLENAISQTFRDTATAPGMFSDDANVVGGYEVRTDPSTYHWHGLRRGADRRHPYTVLQYTLSGRGAIEFAGQTRDVLPGSLFAVVVPSDHCYFMPAESTRWSFVWLILRHRYVAERVARVVSTFGPLFDLPADSPMILAMIQIFEAARRQSFRDRYVAERGQIDLALELDRATHDLHYPRSVREDLLESTRAMTISHLRKSGALSVEDLASQFKMTRSQFSHHFRDQTGLTPARYIAEVRLNEVQRRLISTDDKLQSIAKETGFADATHLCKVFKRHFRMTPAMFRRQMG